MNNVAEACSLLHGDEVDTSGTPATTRAQAGQRAAEVPYPNFRWRAANCLRRGHECDCCAPERPVHTIPNILDRKPSSNTYARFKSFILHLRSGCFLLFSFFVMMVRVLPASARLSASPYSCAVANVPLISF